MANYKKLSLFIPTLIFLIPLTVYVITLAPGLTLGDGGELATAAYKLGVPHPPGFPTWTFLTHFFTLIPYSNIAWRTNFASAIYTASSTVILYLIAKQLANQSGYKETNLVGLIAALLFAFTASVWRNAVIVETNSLMLLLGLISSYFLLLWNSTRNNLHLVLAALFFGLGIGAHYIMFIIAPFVAVYFILTVAKQKKLKTAVTGIFFATAGLLLGLLIFLYLPLAAKTDPAINWGNPKNWDSFLFVVLRKQYSAGLNLGVHIPVRSLESSLGSVGLRLVQTTKTLAQAWWFEFNILNLFLPLGIYCFYRGTKLPQLKTFKIALPVLFVSSYIFAAVVNPASQEPLRSFHEHLLTYAFSAIFISFGIIKLASSAVEVIVNVTNKHKAFTDLVSTFFLLLPLIAPLILLVKNYQLCDWSKNNTARIFVNDLLKNLPANSTFIGSNDILFPLIYTQQVEEKRRDIILKERSGYIHPFAYNIENKSAHYRRTESYLNQIREIENELAENAPGPVFTMYYLPCKDENQHYGLLSTIKGDEELSSGFDLKDNLELFDIDLESVKNDNWSVHLVAAYYWHSGYHAYQENNIEQARKDFDFAEKLDSANFTGLAYGSDCYLLLENYTKALTLLDKAAKIRPDDADIYYRKSQIYEIIGEQQEAVKNAVKAINLGNAYMSEPAKQLANYFAVQNNWQGAQKMLEIVVSKWATDADFDIYYKLGVACLKQGNLNKAAEYFQIALKLNPESEKVQQVLNQLEILVQ